jgi:putative transposase
VHDQLATGRKLRVLTIVDTFFGLSPALEPLLSFRSADVVEVLERVGREVGWPSTIRVDLGSEFVSRDLDLWAFQRGVTLDFLQTGKAQRRCVHRSVQQSLPSGMFERALVPDAWRRVRKDGGLLGLAQVLHNEERRMGQSAPIAVLNHDGTASPPT